MASLSSTPVLDLAQIISNAALVITKSQLQDQMEQPSSNLHAATNGINGTVKKPRLPAAPPTKELLDAKAELIQAASDLSTLTLGPAMYLKSLSYGYHDITALSVVLEFGIATAVPLHGDISFQELSQIVGFDVGRLERILRLLFVRKIFTESRPGYVAHSTVSAYLAENKELAAFLGHCTGEAFPAASRLTDSIRRYPYSEGPDQAGFNLALDTPDPVFTFLSKHPERFHRFNLGMAGISQTIGRSPKQVVEGWDWASLGKATVVDVGGGNGHISVALAQAYPDLKLVVQDLADAVQSGADTLPSSLSDRVSFQAHDMFTVNPVDGAAVYYLRHILHDWPDSHALLILKALVPVLKNGARVLVSDSVIPPPGVLHGQDEKFVRYLDMQMMVLHNARERTEEDFRRLFEQADARLRFQRVWRKGESVAASNILEAKFIDDSVENGV
ncbi:uncharacterized protein KY384_002873 [Bacidia gigantensis]|uniref:uncharacterized protein n=1 Tax=Bacidia gigantensis TaxID=2732470 RepID=UPI001D04C1F4|nr:uncharacterized protein KY384_002873 [Bacidia gigantensis]KAG8532388.1 hypothetical protein KY384_002873 [Bacidia gigantensis]